MSTTDMEPYIKQLENVFNDIDIEYKKGQSHYGGFSCEGCPDNCCKTVFNHYTLAEYFYFCEGLDKLEDSVMEDVSVRARDYFQQIARVGYAQESLEIMCPVNFDGKCIVYENRPLICRVHGLPSVLHTPGRKGQQWNGCNVFQEKNNGTDLTLIIDRTRYFTLIASIEKGIRQEMVFFKKYKKTISEMILDYLRGQIT